MSNAVFLIRELVHEELVTEYEDRCFSIKKDKELGFTVNPYPVNEEDIEESNGMVPDQFEDLLDDHEKLLEILESGTGHLKGKLRDSTGGQCCSWSGNPNALETQTVPGL
ncbi:hypothetical protein, partial [Klebsiella aerogenes]|uniref:hypothetical protein n=1 Tax=Klebsiella aerogenes TaxID=548 RepID=UPI001CC446D3